MSKDKAYQDQIKQIQELKKQYNVDSPKDEKVEDEIEVVDSYSEIVDISEDAVDEKTYEADALKQGWIPKEKYKGDPKDYVDAKTYVERGKEFRKVQQTKHELDSENRKLHDMVKELVDNLKHAEERVRNQTLKELDQRKQQAYSNNDLQYYKQVEQQEQELLHPKREPEGNVKPDGEAFAQFISRGNEWATQEDDASIERRVYATMMSNKYCADHPNASHEEQYDYLHKAVREKYPHYFGLVKEDVSPRVSSSREPAAPRKTERTVDLAKLTASQRMIWEECERNPKSIGMTGKEYLKSIFGTK